MFSFFLEYHHDISITPWWYRTNRIFFFNYHGDLKKKIMHIVCHFTYARFSSCKSILCCKFHKKNFHGSTRQYDSIHNIPKKENYISHLVEPFSSFISFLELFSYNSTQVSTKYLYWIEFSSVESKYFKKS